MPRQDFTWVFPRNKSTRHRLSLDSEFQQSPVNTLSYKARCLSSPKRLLTGLRWSHTASRPFQCPARSAPVKVVMHQLITWTVLNAVLIMTLLNSPLSQWWVLAVVLNIWWHSYCYSNLGADWRDHSQYSCDAGSSFRRRHESRKGPPLSGSPTGHLDKPAKVCAYFFMDYLRRSRYQKTVRWKRDSQPLPDRRTRGRGVPGCGYLGPKLPWYVK